MRIILFTGFLGSGKTTLILDLARYLAEKGLKTAFLINEAGEIPLDGEIIRREGYHVQQLFGGCVCCQVVGDFVSTLKKIIAEEEPDYLLIEPSGIADPSRLTNLISDHKIGEVETICIVDAARLELILKGAKNLLENGIKSSRMIIINKTDIIGENDLQEVSGTIKQINPDASLYPVSAKKGIPCTLWAEVVTE